MKKTFLTEYDSYSEIMNLIDCAEKSASRLLCELHRLPSITEQLHNQKKHYETILLRVLNNTQMLKAEWTDIGLEPQNYFANLPDIYSDYQIIKKSVEELQGTINNIQSTGLFVNPEGILFQTTNCARS